MKSAISQPFSVTASKEPISVKSIARYYLTEASGTTPFANDSRWKLVKDGEAVPLPSAAAPYLWKKTVTTFTDGTSSTAIEFAGSLGKNGIDYDLVPSCSSIVKAEDGTLTPANVTCKIIKRNADGTAENLSSVPTGYSIAVYRDFTTVSSSYTPGSNVSTSGTTTSMTFVLKYGTVEIERHTLNVIAEGGQGVDGRGIQSQDYRFKATASSSTPSSPTDDTTWNTWSALSSAAFSASNPYLWRCCKTVYVDGNGNTETTYLVDGPTVWGQDGDDAVYLGLDNPMDSILVNSAGAMTAVQSFTIHATLYKGASPVTGGITAPTASAIALNGVTPTVNTSGGVVTIQYAFTSIPTIFENRHYTVTIPVVYGGKTYSAVFTLAPVRTGDPGNGIASVSFARMFTMAFSAPASNASGWIASTSSSYPSESGLSKENRYLWQRKTTTYTRSDVATTYEVSLLAQYESGVCANLLEDTAFNDINDMDAWMEKAGSVALRVFENTNGFSFAPISNAAYRDVLKQEVYLSTGIKKLEANTWYTFSFYGAMYASHNIYNSAQYQSNNVSPYYQVQNVSDQLYLDNSQSITVDVTGYVASTLVYMCYYIYRKKSDGSWAQSAQCKFTSTSTKTIRMTLTNNSGAAAQYYLGGYVYNSDGTQNTSSATSHRGYINKVVCYRGCCIDTYFYNASGASAVVADSSAPWICDGTVCNGTTSLPDAGSYPQMNGTWVQCSGNGHVRWQMNPVTKRHYVTFKTVSTLNANQSYRILFRATGYAHSGWICMPKLERNTMATEWIEHSNDRMASDFQHIYAGVWSASTAYMYANGVRHVVRAKESYNGGMTYFRLKKRTSASGYKNSTEPYSDTRYWEEASYLKFVATDLMLADQAIIGFAKTNRIEVYNSAGNVAAGMGGAVNGDNDFPLWIGASYGSRANAPFRVTLAGKMYATGCEISGNSTFSGTLKGVIGTFRQLQAIDSNGAVKAEIGFNSAEGKLYFSGDMQHQGYDSENNRSYRFLTSDLWCRGVFGARERSCMVVYGSYAYVYTKGFENNYTGTNITLTSTTLNDKTTYILPCYSPRSDSAAATAGFPVDVIILRQATVQYYKLSMALSQRVLVLNGNDKLSAFIIQNGNWIEWHGGEVAEVFQSPTSILNPTPTGEGAGQIIGAFRDNNWS